MTIEEKARAYDEALEKARAVYGGIPADNTMLEEIFPVLQRNDDYKILRLLEWYIKKDIDICESISTGLSKYQRKKILAYIEKQKESLHIPEISKESANSFINDDGDERIRKWLIDYFSSIKETVWIHRDIACEQILAWLEKQKENIEKEYVFRPLAGTDITVAAEQAIRRANEGDRLVLAFNGAYIPVRKGNNAKELVDIYDAYLEKQKEPHYTKRNALFDKCVENCDPEVMKSVSDEVDEMLKKEQKPSLCDECKKKSTCLDTKYGDDRVVEQCINFVKMKQKTEWSDTKELVFKDICNHLKEEGYSGWVLLLNALRNGEFQPKPEWSEEDDMLMDELESYILYDKEFNDEQKSWRIKRLKSLRPDSYKNCNSQWKPSEEQMKALKNSAYGTYQNGDGPVLRGLYEQLEKLM